MSKKPNRRKVYGPYDDPRGPRVFVVHPTGERISKIFRTKGEAKRFVRLLQKEIEEEASLTLEEALERYKLYQQKKGNKSASIATTLYRLLSFFGDSEMTLAFLTPRLCENLYEEHTLRYKADTHRNTLSQAKTFLNWCVKNKLLSANPAAHIEGIGKRVKGKKQLRIDEARLFIQRAFFYAEKGEDGAIACLMALLLGLRASEVTQRIVRDLDDEGRILWIANAKTEAGKRRLAIPESLRPFLQEAAKGKTPFSPLLGQEKHHERGFVRNWTKKICKELGLPEITAHSLRGLHATLATASGVSSFAVARALGHEEVRTTQEHYTSQEATEGIKQSRVLQVLQGGKS